MSKAYSKRHDHVSSRFVRRQWGNSYAKADNFLPDQRDRIKPPEFKPAVIRRRKNKETRMEG